MEFATAGVQVVSVSQNRVTLAGLVVSNAANEDYRAAKKVQGNTLLLCSVHKKVAARSLIALHAYWSVLLMTPGRSKDRMGVTWALRVCGEFCRTSKKSV